MLRLTTLAPVERGWSEDRKYRAEAADGRRFLLRVTTGERAKTRRELFDLQGCLAEMGVPMCAPIEIEEDGDGARVLYEWIDGRDAEEAIALLPEAERYRYGHTAGEILRKIHSLPAPEDLPPWEERYGAKLDRKIAVYRACPVHFEGDEAALSYIEMNRGLLRGRPQTFQHGDYHTGNLMVDTSGRLIIIDFDRYGWGDPWEEFNRIPWCARLSPSFASGMVDGYFGGPPPDIFWRLLALYLGANMLSSIPWAIPFGEQEVRVMLDQAAFVLSWYPDEPGAIPAWYAPPNKV